MPRSKLSVAPFVHIGQLSAPVQTLLSPRSQVWRFQRLRARLLPEERGQGHPESATTARWFT